MRRGHHHRHGEAPCHVGAVGAEVRADGVVAERRGGGETAGLVAHRLPVGQLAGFVVIAHLDDPPGVGDDRLSEVGAVQMGVLEAGRLEPGNRSGAWIPNLTATALAVTGWGWFLYQGVVDPLGGINTLWPLFGIANQMLAAIALTLCSVVLFRMKRESYAFIALIPTAWLYICTLTAGVEKIFHPDLRIGFLAHAARYGEALANDKLLAPAKSMLEMRRIVFNDYVDASLAALLIALVLTMGAFGLKAMRDALRSEVATTRETQDGVLQTAAA